MLNLGLNTETYIDDNGVQQTVLTSDIALDASGNISIVSDFEAIKCRINTALKTIFGESDNESIGVKYYEIIFPKGDLRIKVQEFMRIINNIDGVLESKVINILPTQESGIISYSFEIKTIYGTYTVTQEG